MKGRSHTWPMIAALVAGSFLLISFTATAQNDISTANTSRHVAEDLLEWTVFIKAPESVLQNIRCVEYKLPSTFSKSTKKVCSLGDKSQPFALKSNGWATFDIAIRVVFKTGKPRSFRHKLSFEPAVKS